MPVLKRFKLDGLAQIGYDEWVKAQPQAIAVDTETTGLTWRDYPFGVTIAWERDTTTRNRIGRQMHYFELNDELSEAYVRQILAVTPQIILHNSKFDFEMLIRAGLLERSSLTYDRFHDTECLAQLLDENRLKGLKPLARSVLGKETNETEVLNAAFREAKIKKEEGFHRIPREVVIPYAVMDARFTFDLWEVFMRQLPPDLAPLYDQERKLTLALLDMETAGMKVDRDYVRTQVKAYGTRILRAELRIAEIVGHADFNPNSPKQILTAFQEVGISLDATGEAELSEVDHPLASAILELRGLNKIRNTYLTSMLDESPDGILHPSIRQHGTKTGRMSSGGATNN